MTDAYIYDGVRSPRGRGKDDGSLRSSTAVDVSAQMIDAIIERNEIPCNGIEDVIWGNATQIGEQGGCLARAAVLLSRLEQSVPGLTVNRFCASGLEAVNLAAAQIRNGRGVGYVSGGVEMMSRIKMGSDGSAMAVDPRIAIDCAFVPPGIAADLIATEYGFSREDCDRYAVRSQQSASTAWSEGRFSKSIVPVVDINGIEILARDEHMTPETSMESLATLKPSFLDIGAKMPGFDRVALLKYPHLERIEHVHHSGNSSGKVDGAAAVLLGDSAFGEKHGIKPRARVCAAAKVGSEPTIMLTGPLRATEIVLAEAGMSIGDIDLFEVNEAFSSIPLLFMQAFEIDESRLNVNGGAIAMGHPLGATGAMLLTTAIDELERANLSTALVTLCVGGGMGVATVIERV